MADNQDRFNDAMNRGHTAAWDQDWQEAAHQYQKALEERPTDPIGLVSLGLALFELGSYDDSLGYYSKAIEIAPEDPLAYDKAAQLHELLGNTQSVVSPALLASELYLKQGNAAKSIECLARVIRVDPENLRAHSRLALIFERSGRKQQAVTEFLVVASLLQHKGDSEDAQQAVAHALEILPGSIEAQQALASLSEGQPLPRPVPVELILPRIDRAEEISKPEPPIKPDQSELDPIAETHELAVSDLANLIIDQSPNGGDPGNQGVPGGRVNLQEVDSSRFFRTTPDTKLFIHLRRAVDLLSQSSKGAAADELEKAVELGLDHPAAYFQLGAVRSQEDRLESAIRYLQRALDDPAYALASRLLIARTYRYMDRLSEASSNYLEALRLADAMLLPDEQSDVMLRMYSPIIEAESKRTDPQEKNQLCDTIEDLLVRPGWQSYLLQARGDFQIDVEGVPSIPIGELISNPQGNRIVESVRQINQYARSSHWRSAMEEAFFAIQFAPTYLPLHTYMGELLLKQDHLPEAVEKFSAIAKTYRARGENGHAAKILQRIIKSAPMDLGARSQLISLHEEVGNIDQAIEEKINLAGVFYNLADLSRARDVYLDAFKLAQNYRSSTETKVRILYHLADIELQSLDWKHAEEIYSQIQSITPNDPRSTKKLIEIKIRLGQDQQAQHELDEYISMMMLNQDLDAVLDYVGNLVMEYPDRVFLRDKKAAIHLELGQKNQAIEEYDKVGEILLDSGNRQGAIEAIEKILALNPSNRDQYQDLVDQLSEDN